MYRIANLQDVSAISKILIDSWRVTYKELITVELLDLLTYEWAEKHLAGYLVKEEHGAFVAINDNGDITAFVTYMPYADIPNCILLDSLHVTSTCQGKGVGKALISIVGQHAYSQGFNKMVLTLIIGNTRAENIYTYLGAKHLKDFTDYLEGYPADARMLIWDDVSIFTRN